MLSGLRLGPPVFAAELLCSWFDSHMSGPPSPETAAVFARCPNAPSSIRSISINSGLTSVPVATNFTVAK